MRITPVNEAEAILDPFWDPSLSELDRWIIESGDDHGLVVSQNWCWVAFEWLQRPESTPALCMKRTCKIDTSQYDHLVISIMPPENSLVRITAETELGEKFLEQPTVGIKKVELALPLAGAQRLDAVTIEIWAGSAGTQQGWLNWLGLHNSRRLKHRLSQHSPWDAQWEKHLKDGSYKPTFVPSYGLLLNSTELAVLRQKHAALLVAGYPSPFELAAQVASSTPPESLIQDYVSFWGDTRYNRQRDHGRQLLSHGLNAAIAGHLLQDKNLLRLAARYALSIAMCKNWDDGFICRFPGSTFEHRCFVQSLCAYDIAGILDLAGECFTDLGRNFLLRRLAEEAVSAIQYNAWKHDYIFYCNQLAWFSPGRILALAVLERHWQRVRSYLDIAFEELVESLGYSILPDGGYVEGPSYFRCVGRDAGLAIYHYSRATGGSITNLVPPAMKRTGKFAAAMISTDIAQDMIPICDGSPLHEVLSQAMMAKILPASAWSNMLCKSIARNGGYPFKVLNPENRTHVANMADAAIAWSMLEELPEPETGLQDMVIMPEMGPLVSHRLLKGHQVKLFIQGNRAGAGHTHEDKGSFVLEFAGETFAMDPGTCDYSHPLASELKNCERHNMLVPYGLPQRPAPQCPLPHDVKPFGKGGDKAFSAEINAAPGWDGIFKLWRRTWESPKPAILTITDDYELASGEGVEFYWQTRLPVSIKEHKAEITGQQGHVSLEAPPGLNWRLDELPLLDGTQHRLALSLPGRTGSLQVRARLES
jgi:hypothetical protein